MKTLCPDTQGSDCWKIAHITEVYSSYWRVGGWETYSLECLCDKERNPWLSSVLKSDKLETCWKQYFVLDVLDVHYLYFAYKSLLVLTVLFEDLHWAQVFCK